MGKTSLLVMLKLIYLMSFWPQQRHCQLLKLGPDTLDQIKAIPAAGDTVLLLDALDEDGTAWGKVQERLLQILAATSHFRRVIVSCRPQLLPETSSDPLGNPGEVEVGGFLCPMIFLSLFDDLQVEEYLAKRHPDTWFRWFQTNSKREQAQGFVAKLRDLRCRPLLLAHIEDLAASTLTDWNEYAVYQALVQAWLDREEGRLRKEGHPDITAASLSRASRLVASHLQRNGLRSLTEPRLAELIQAHPEVAHLTRISFGGRSLLNRNAQGDYRFSHFSVQEYLAARDLLQTSQAKERLEVPKYASEKVIRFVLDGRTRLCPQKPLVLRGLNLARFDLSGVNLEGADLSGANLSGAKLDGAKLRNVRLEGANLAGVCLSHPVEGFPFVQRINQGVSIGFVWIPPGSFLMGAPGEQVEVTLSRGYWMGKHPVTQKQYEGLLGENPSHFKQSGPEAPVERVSWDEAGAFSRKLQDHLGQAGNRHECRLPTEAEWEYACRAVSHKNYCFGDDESKLKEYAWYGWNSEGITHAVGQKKPNQWGLSDMHGNVWEWCLDWHGPYPKKPVTDPTGPEQGESRVLRGGSWRNVPEDLRSAFRLSNAPGNCFSCIGFRCVWVGGSSPQAGTS